MNITGFSVPAKFTSLLEKGDCIAVVGAGLSMPDYPSWPELYTRVAVETGIEEVSATKTSPLEFEALRQKAGFSFWPAVSKILGDRCVSDRVKERYNNLVTLNWRGIVTTNLDEQIRAAFARVGRPLDFVLSWIDGQEDPFPVSQLLEHKDWIFQLHGERFHPQDAVLSIADYTAVWGRDHGTKAWIGVGSYFMESLAAKAACFLGYSFRDKHMFGNQPLLNRRAISDSPWYAIISESEAMDEMTKTAVAGLKIELLKFKNINGGFYEIDDLLRNLAPLFPAESLGGAHEAVFRKSAMAIIGASTDDPGLMKIFKEISPITFADIDLRCQLLPSDLWERHMSHSTRAKAIFLDDAESNRQIRISIADVTPPIPVEQLMGELDKYLESKEVSAEQKNAAQEVKGRLQAGQNPYPRLAAPPTEQVIGDTAFLAITVAPNTYGVTVLSERGVKTPSIQTASAVMNLNSLAVRIAYTYYRDKKKYCVFHQRKAAENATYYKAWDIGAAGYIDPRRHEDLGRLSPWLAAAKELQEELNIRLEYLPHRDHYEFFGLVRNGLSNQLDLLGECKGDFWADWETHLPGAKVERIEACELSPEKIAVFIRDKHWWVPTAILTVILVLQGEYSHSEIEQAFRKYNLAGAVYLGKDSEHS